MKQHGRGAWQWQRKRTFDNARSRQICSSQFWTIPDLSSRRLEKFKHTMLGPLWSCGQWKCSFTWGTSAVADDGRWLDLDAIAAAANTSYSSCVCKTTSETCTSNYATQHAKEANYYQCQYFFRRRQVSLHLEPHRSCHSSFQVRHWNCGFAPATVTQRTGHVPSDAPSHHSALMLLYMRNTNLEAPIKPSEPQNKERPIQKFSDVPK